LGYGAEVDESISEHCCPSPVSTACLYGREAIVRILLGKKKELAKIVINKRIIENGLTPLMFAALSGRRPLAELLASRGADPDAVNVNWQTALDLSEALAHAEVRSFLQGKTTVVKSEFNRLSRSYQCPIKIAQMTLRQQRNYSLQSELATWTPREIF